MRPFRRRDLGLSAALEHHFAGGVDVCIGHRRLELDDVGGKLRRRLFLVLGVVFQLWAELGKQLGGDFCASRKIAQLRMLGFRAEGVLGAAGVGRGSGKTCDPFKDSKFSAQDLHLLAQPRLGAFGFEQGLHLRK